MPALSIIIPVYNVEKHLDRCLGSIQSQTSHDWELILVDDGATDRSGVLCDKYAAEDTRITVIHTTNGGQGRARNLALDVATGRYLTFIDSDDYLIDETAFERGIRTLEENEGIDIVQFGYQNVSPDGKLSHVYRPRQLVYESAIEFFEHYSPLAGDSPESIYVPIWGKFYRRGLFSKVSFIEGMKLEDVAVNADLFLQARKIAFCQEIIYGYADNPSSTMRQGQSASRANDAIRANLHVLRLAKIAGIPDEAYCSYHYKIFHEVCCVTHLHGIRFDQKIFTELSNLALKSKRGGRIANQFVSHAINLFGARNVYRVVTAIMALKRKLHTTT